MQERKWKWKYEIGDIIDNIKIINRKSEIVQVKSKNTKSGLSFVTKKYYQYKCLKCGFNGSIECYRNGKYLIDHWVDEEALVQGTRCACCHGTVVQTGINDVATTDPEVVQYFADKNLANKYSRSAKAKIDIQCPICGFINPTQATIYNLVWEGVSCFKCGKSISYPEKLMYFALKQLDISFALHKTFDWSKNIKNTFNDKRGNKEYDFYLPDYNLIIELHGKQHYSDGTPFNVYGERGRTLQEEQENDKLKEYLAIQNNYQYISIDCKESSLEYIKNSICNSKLKEHIDILNIDWAKCHKSSISGIKMLVINEKANNPNMSSFMLAEKYGVTRNTIINWLKQGAGICNYDAREELRKSGLYANHFRPVYSKELNMAFDSIKSAAAYVGIAAPNISACLALSNKQKCAGKHPITQERLSWEYISKDQYEDWCKLHNQPPKSLFISTN